MLLLATVLWLRQQAAGFKWMAASACLDSRQRVGDLDYGLVACRRDALSRSMIRSASWLDRGEAARYRRLAAPITEAYLEAVGPM